MTENVLLLCLSMLNPVSKINEYSYSDDNKDCTTITGYLTNEAPAKYIIHSLAQNNSILNKIVIICSETVMKPIGRSFDGDISSANVLGLTNGKEIQDATHLEYFIDVITQFAKSQSDAYLNNRIQFEIVEIPDYTMQEDVSKAVIEASTRILESDNEINLFIDFNGGQRYIAFMILAISSLMKIRHVNISSVLTMNWGERDQQGRIPIRNMKDLFLTIDLAAGIKEYTNYGRTKGLKDYFGSTSNQRIKTLISEMSALAENLQLCRTDFVMDNRERLLKRLNEFIHEEKKDSVDTETLLFYYVVSDILQEYRGLLDGDLPDIIKWCIDHDFVQQAITFCTDQMPQYFMDNGILYPSKQEKTEFSNFLKCVAEKKKKDEFIPEFTKKTFTKPGVAEENPLFAYYWMVNYLLFSFGDNRGPLNDYKTVTANCHQNMKQLMFIGPSKEEMKKYYKISIPFIRTSCAKRTQNKLAQKTQWYLSCKRDVRAESRVKNCMDYVNMYYFLKDQRNSINHSDGESKDRWNYNLLCEALERFADELLSLKAIEQV